MRYVAKTLADRTLHLADEPHTRSYCRKLRGALVVVDAEYAAERIADRTVKVCQACRTVLADRRAQARAMQDNFMITDTAAPARPRPAVEPGLFDLGDGDALPVVGIEAVTAAGIPQLPAREPATAGPAGDRPQEVPGWVRGLPMVPVVSAPTVEPARRTCEATWRKITRSWGTATEFGHKECGAPATTVRWVKAAHHDYLIAVYACDEHTRAGAARIKPRDVTTEPAPAEVWEGEGGAVPGVAAPTAPTPRADDPHAKVAVFIASQNSHPARLRVLWWMHRDYAVRLCSDPRTSWTSSALHWTAADPEAQGVDWEFVQDRRPNETAELFRELSIIPTEWEEVQERKPGTCHPENWCNHAWPCGRDFKAWSAKQPKSRSELRRERQAAARAAKAAPAVQPQQAESHEHAANWIEMRADLGCGGTSYHAVCQCGQEVGAWTGRQPSISTGTLRKPLTIWDAPTSAGDSFAMRSGFDVTGPWQVVSESVKRAPIKLRDQDERPDFTPTCGELCGHSVICRPRPATPPAPPAPVVADAAPAPAPVPPAAPADVTTEPAPAEVWEGEGGAVPGVDTPTPANAAAAVMPIDWAKPAGRGDCAAANSCGGFGVLLWDVPGCAPRCAECAATVMGHSPEALRGLTLPADVAQAEAEAEAADIVIRHTHEDGTTVEGSTRGDGVWEALRPLGWTYRRNPGIFIRGSRYKGADRWKINRAADAVRALGLSCAVVIEETMSFAEREAARVDAAEDRAQRFADRAGRAAAESDRLWDAHNSIGERFFMGQPILIGHHSEKRARRDQERMWAMARKSVSEQRRAGYWASRAAASEAYERYRKNPGRTLRRIEKLEAERRGVLRERDGVDDKGRKADVWRREPSEERRQELTRRLAEYDEELTYWAETIKEAERRGFKVWGRADFVKGDFALWRGSWYEVARVNAKTVSVPHIHAAYDGGTVGAVNGCRVVTRAATAETRHKGSTYTLPYNEISGRMSAEQMRAALAGEEIPADPRDAAPEPAPEEAEAEQVADQPAAAVPGQVTVCGAGTVWRLSVPARRPAPVRVALQAPARAALPAAPVRLALTAAPDADAPDVAGLDYRVRAALLEAASHPTGKAPGCTNAWVLQELIDRGAFTAREGVGSITEAGRRAAATLPRERVVIVPCGGKKQQDSEVCEAGAMYVGSYHKACRRAAEVLAGGDGRVLILSAKFGLLKPSHYIPRYDLKAGDPGTVSAESLREQAHKLYITGADVTVLGGAEYVQLVRQVWQDAQAPLSGCRGIGEQLARLAAIYKDNPAPAVAEAPTGGPVADQEVSAGSDMAAEDAPAPTEPAAVPAPAGPELPAGMYLLPLPSTRYRDWWGVQCGRCHGGARIDLPGEWDDKAEAARAAHDHYDQAHRPADDRLTTEELAEVERWPLSDAQRAVLSYAEYAEVAEFDDGFWALDCVPDRWDVHKRLSRPRVTGLWAAGLLNVVLESNGRRCLVKSPEGHRVARLLWRAERQGIAEPAAKDAKLPPLPKRQGGYPLQSEGRYFKGEKQPAAEPAPTPVTEPAPAPTGPLPPAELLTLF